MSNPYLQVGNFTPTVESTDVGRRLAVRLTFTISRIYIVERK